MSNWWYISSRKMTLAVEVKNGIITAAAPIGRKFIGQPAKNLSAWMRNQGGFKCEKIQ